jgi:hypothetical protein|tara:strand:- start:3276 stop:3650 length:375 start_codon:yes stop_codon:yes gene_type:complete
MPKIFDENGAMVYECPYSEEGNEICAQKLQDNPGWTLGGDSEIAPGRKTPGMTVQGGGGDNTLGKLWKYSSPTSFGVDKLWGEDMKKLGKKLSFSSGGVVPVSEYSKTDKGWGVTRVRRGHRVR